MLPVLTTTVPAAGPVVADGLAVEARFVDVPGDAGVDELAAPLFALPGVPFAPELALGAEGSLIAAESLIAPSPAPSPID